MTIEASDDSLKAKKVRFPARPSKPTHTTAYDAFVLLTNTDTHNLTGQGRRRRLQDNPGAPDRTPQRRYPDAQRFQQRRRAGRVPQEGRLLEHSGLTSFGACSYFRDICIQRGGRTRKAQRAVVAAFLGTHREGASPRANGRHVGWVWGHLRSNNEDISLHTDCSRATESCL